MLIPIASTTLQDGYDDDDDDEMCQMEIDFDVVFHFISLGAPRCIASLVRDALRVLPFLISICQCKCETFASAAVMQLPLCQSTRVSSAFALQRGTPEVAQDICKRHTSRW